MENKSFDINNLVRENISQLQPYSSARDDYSDYGSSMIYLDANENPNENNLNRYPDPFQLKLKSKLSDMKSIPVENIFLGNGSDEVIDLIFRAFCEPRLDQIITMPPTYGMYRVLAKINDVDNKEVLLTPDFQIDTFELLENITSKTKLIFICSPNNPTGNLMDIDDIVFILENFNGLVIIDEAYIDFCDLSESWLKEVHNYQNLIVLQTLSKAYGLAGIRLGICYANAEIINILNRIKAPYNVSQLSQIKALDVLTEQCEIKEQIVESNLNKKVLEKEFMNIQFIEKIYPSKANFVLIKVDNANKRYKQLLENRIVVRNRTNEPLCSNCLRISIVTKIESEKLVKILKKIDK